MNKKESYYYIVKDKRRPKAVYIVSNPFETKEGAIFMANHMHEQFDPRRDRDDYNNLQFIVIKSHGNNDREVLENARTINNNKSLIKKPRLADKIKLPKIKNSWLVKRSRGR